MSTPNTLTGPVVLPVVSVCVRRAAMPNGTHCETLVVLPVVSVCVRRDSNASKEAIASVVLPVVSVCVRRQGTPDPLSERLSRAPRGFSLREADCPICLPPHLRTVVVLPVVSVCVRRYEGCLYRLIIHSRAPRGFSLREAGRGCDFLKTALHVVLPVVSVCVRRVIAHDRPPSRSSCRAPRGFSLREAAPLSS